jgi:hypothetical protein
VVGASRDGASKNVTAELEGPLRTAALSISCWPKMDGGPENPAASPNLVEKAGPEESPNFVEIEDVALSPNLVEKGVEAALSPKLVEKEGVTFSPNFAVAVKAGASGLNAEPEPDLDCGGAANTELVSGMKKLCPSS